MKILVGNILESKAQTLINTVNCVGIMGKGIAAGFKQRFSEMFEDYLVRCNRNEVKQGVPYLFKTLFPPQVVNFPTKSHWRAASHIEDIERGLKIILDKYKEWGITSIAVPPLGCGNGQLLWATVGPLMYQYLSKLDIPVELYAPYGTPPVQLTEKFLSQDYNLREARSGANVTEKLNLAWIVLVEIIHRIQEKPYHSPIGRTIFQKIAFVATDQGLPTGLKYVKGSYGPYCKDLDEVKKRLADAGFLQERILGSMYQVLPGLAFKKGRPEYLKKIQKWDPLIDKTVDLFLRLNTNQAEIVSTVLFTSRELKVKENASEKDALQAVMQWKQKRRPPLNNEEVADVIRNLEVLQWFQLKYSQDLIKEDA
jgi:O-acetyl-ADP-ribose deacetylase (regulator of RNase III)/uncharacterized protein YwgA